MEKISPADLIEYAAQTAQLSSGGVNEIAQASQRRANIGFLMKSGSISMVIGWEVLRDSAAGSL